MDDNDNKKTQEDNLKKQHKKTKPKKVKDDYMMEGWVMGMLIGLVVGGLIFGDMLTWSSLGGFVGWIIGIIIKKKK